MELTTGGAMNISSLALWVLRLNARICLWDLWVMGWIAAGWIWFWYLNMHLGGTFWLSRSMKTSHSSIYFFLLRNTYKSLSTITRSILSSLPWWNKTIKYCPAPQMANSGAYVQIVYSHVWILWPIHQLRLLSSTDPFPHLSKLGDFTTR